MISLTENAARKLTELIQSSPPEERPLGVKPAVQGGGCSGFKYLLEFLRTPDESLTELESHGVKIFVDKKSYLYLMGTEIDYVDDLNNSGFKFNNPSTKRTCGCGESFSI